MKYIFFLAVLIFISAPQKAAAHLTRVSDRSWQDLASDRYVKIQWPMVNIQNNLVPLNQVCTTGTMFRSLVPYSVCTKSFERTKVCTFSDTNYPDMDCSRAVGANYQLRSQESFQREQVCLTHEMQYVSAPISHQVTACVDSAGNDANYFGELYDGHLYCGGKMSLVTRVTPVVYSVPIIRADSDRYQDESGPSVLGEKSYTIQNCEGQYQGKGQYQGQSQAQVQQPAQSQSQGQVQQPAQSQSQGQVQQPAQSQSQGQVQQPAQGQSQGQVQQPTQGQSQGQVQQPTQGQNQGQAQQPAQGQSQSQAQQPYQGQEQEDEQHGYHRFYRHDDDPED